MSLPLTAGEECQLAAKTLSAFVDTNKNGAIPPSFINATMALAVLRGETGVAVVRLSTGEWSAPCAIQMTNPTEAIRPAQETVLLFMSESSVLSLVSKSLVCLNQTHRFLPGPLNASASLDPGADVYVYVRYNSGFTDAHLVQAAMLGWRVNEDPERHARWHGPRVTWFDVLTNKISVDRSSVGNALYLVLNLAAGQTARSGGPIQRRNFPDISRLQSTGLDRSNDIGSANNASAWERQQWQGQATDSFRAGMGNSTAFYGSDLNADNGNFNNMGMMGYQQQQQQQQQLQQQIQQQHQLQQLHQQQQQLQLQQQLQYQQQLNNQSQQFSHQSFQQPNLQNRQPTWQEQLLQAPQHGSQGQYGGYRQG